MDAPEATDDARPEAGANLVNRAARIGAILFALCLIYVLSLGPAVAVFEWAGAEEAHPAAARAARIIYAPLEYLHGHTPLKEPLDLYAGWWGRLGKRLR